MMAPIEVFRNLQLRSEVAAAPPVDPPAEVPTTLDHQHH
jgi:hypothetical protein